MTRLVRTGPTYVPRLRQWVKWEYDVEAWPFVKRTDEVESEDEFKYRLRLQENMRRYGQALPEEPGPNDPGFKEYMRSTVDNYLLDMADAGFWDIEKDEDGRIRPVAKAVEFKMGDFPEGSTMAHIMYRAGVFSSVSEARKNGWNKPIECGEYVVGKSKKRIRVK